MARSDLFCLMYPINSLFVAGMLHQQRLLLLSLIIRILEIQLLDMGVFENRNSVEPICARPQ